MGLLALVECADSPKTTLPSLPQSGRFIFTINSGGYERVAQVHIPKGYKPDSKPPLLLLLPAWQGGLHAGKNRRAPPVRCSA